MKSDIRCGGEDCKTERCADKCDGDRCDCVKCVGTAHGSVEHGDARRSSFEYGSFAENSMGVDAAIERWSDTILRLCLSRLCNQADAEDAFQDTFLALCKAGIAFQSTEHQKAWLLRCAINCCNQIMRRKSLHARKTQELQEAKRDRDCFVEEYEVDSELEEALNRLTDNQRTAVHLFYFEGYSTDEIATLTGEKPATVRSHLHRARRALRLELSNEREVASCEKMTSSADTTPCNEA